METTDKIELIGYLALLATLLYLSGRFWGLVLWGLAG